MTSVSFSNRGAVAILLAVGSLFAANHVAARLAFDNPRNVLPISRCGEQLLWKSNGLGCIPLGFGHVAPTLRALADHRDTHIRGVVDFADALAQGAGSERHRHPVALGYA